MQDLLVKAMMEDISVHELKKWQEENRDLLLLDVREDFERELFHIGGEWVPLGAIHTIEHFPADLPIVCYCRKGIRSQIAIQRLQIKFPEIRFYNLTGGISAWQDAFPEAG